jgi:predicted RNase H-like HicB family nuclease
MSREFTAVIRKEGKWFVAQCIEVDVASQGRTEKAALKNLQEALELHFENPQATVLPAVHRVNVKVHAA